MEHGGFEGLVGGENGDLFVGGAEDFVDVVGDSGFAGGAGDGDEPHVFNRVAIVGAEELGAEFLGF